MKRFFLLFSVFALFPVFKSEAQKPKEPLTRILFILDASNSMTTEWKGKVKINAGVEVLAKMVDSLEQIENVQVGLRVYGHQSPVPPQNCNDTRLEIPFDDNNAEKIRIYLNYIRPKGTTPIANSLKACADDFPPCENCRNIVVLITDGIEACDGDPCEISLALQKKGIILKPFVIGVGLEVDLKSQFECIGSYYDATSPESFASSLNDVITQVMSKSSAQVDLYDINKKPLETNVNMTFYDAFSGRMIHNYIHTLNAAGKPDTLNLDPMITYKIKVHTIPPVFSQEFKLKPDEHLIVGIDAPQGQLILTSPANPFEKEVNFIVRKAGDNQTLDVQYLNSTEKYIVGKYDIEVLTFPRIYFKDVEIKQSTKTELKVPQLGCLTVYPETPGFGSIYKINDSGDVEWMVNLDSQAKKEIFYFIPGNYKVVLRKTDRKSTLSTFEKTFTMEAGKALSINLNY